MLILDMLNNYEFACNDRVIVKPGKSKVGKESNNFALCNTNSFITSAPFEGIIEEIHPRYYVIRTKAGYMRCISKQDNICGDYRIIKDIDSEEIYVD